MNANQRKLEKGAKRLRKKQNREANTGLVEASLGSKKLLVEGIEIEEERFPSRRQGQVPPEDNPHD